MLCYLHRTSTREIFSISSQMKEFIDNVLISQFRFKMFFLLGKLQACPDIKAYIRVPLFNTAVDCSQPSVFSYFNSIVERASRIARELDGSAKTGDLGALSFAHFLFRVRGKYCEHSNKEFFSAEAGGGSLQSSNTITPQSDFTLGIKVTLLR